ncbi:hypothetical protein [Stutzerimonas nitrititolerans]|uniref:hypothetical protein n=1 Tax=Stutzerimonas nitrititolerans TaxID=2482751 RepID=UPI0028986730|nr:hypothetical protein [Stutzerimonas nitrititolerans]
MQISKNYLSGLPSNYSTPSNKASQTPVLGDNSTISLSFEALLATQSMQENSKATGTQYSSPVELMAAQMGKDNTATKSPSAVTAISGKTAIDLEKIDMENLLTDEDKRLTGWPDVWPNWVAVYIALDRKEGSLQGPVSRDYVVGNPELNIVGLTERDPYGITSQIVDQILERLAG